jgi:hypothetical protein
LVATDERNSSDVGVCADVSNSVFASLNNVNDAIGDTRLLQKVKKDLHGAGHLLRGLHDVGVAKSNGDWEHPKGAHGREIERSDSSANTEGHSVRVEVNALGDVSQGLTLVERGEAASVLNDLEASEHITLGIDEGLAVLFSNDGGDFVLVNRYAK